VRLFIFRFKTRNRKNLFQLGYSGKTAWIVENCDTGKFGNGFFKQLQPLPA
jgi:hypothetical protein